MKIVSLFSGAGGLDLGLEMAGHSIIWANDIDADAVTTYRRSIGDHIHLADISTLSDAALPDCDVVVGGFPCQGFSQANLLRYGGDERNQLYRQFLRVVALTKPKYFLAENVRGILSLEGGSAIKRIVKDFSRAGYRVNYKLFNAADFGVPQTRMRVIIAGTRSDLSEGCDFEFPSPTHSKEPKAGLRRWVTVQEALENVPDPDLFPTKVPNQIYSKYKVTNRNFTGHRSTDPSKPSPTILARGNGGGGVCAIQHPNGRRRMSVRESATIQCFPLTFEFFGAMNSQYRQVGNAVPVRFARALGDCLSAAERRLKQGKALERDS